MHVQHGTATTVVAKGGDYALTLKGNQETLREFSGRKKTTARG